MWWQFIRHWCPVVHEACLLSWLVLYHHWLLELSCTCRVVSKASRNIAYRKNVFRYCLSVTIGVQVEWISHVHLLQRHVRSLCFYRIGGTHNVESRHSSMPVLRTKWSRNHSLCSNIVFSHVRHSCAIDTTCSGSFGKELAFLHISSALKICLVTWSTTAVF